jgi:hypothetical protein
MDEGGSTGGCDSARSTATRWRSLDRRGAARSRQARFDRGQQSAEQGRRPDSAGASVGQRIPPQWCLFNTQITCLRASHLVPPLLRICFQLLKLENVIHGRGGTDHFSLATVTQNPRLAQPRTEFLKTIAQG